MATENPIFSYTRRDYEESRKEGIAKIPLLSKGNWTDLNATDPGIIILDYVHALVDMVNYYQDHQALETFITTAKERVNLFRLAKQLSYEVRSSKGAICNVEFMSPYTYNKTIKIPRYTSLKANTGAEYLTIEDAYLLPGESRITIPCSQGTVNTMTYQGTGISRFSNISGASNQQFRIVAPNIDVSSITVTDHTGNLWLPVDYIVFSMEEDKVYQVELNPDDSVTIKFGDGERGVVPKETDVFTITYITTLAEEGRVGINSITSLTRPIYDEEENYIDFVVNNNTASSGGSSSQSSRDIRELAPGAIKAQNRAVTLNDFENLAKLVDGVADAKAYDINTKPELCLYHEVKVLIVPRDKEGSLEVLKDQVYKFLYNKMIPPTNLQILTPSIVPIDIDITVKKLDTVAGGQVSYAIQQAINTYFNEREGAIGEPYYPSDLLSRVALVGGVKSVLSLTPNNTIPVEDFSVLSLRNLHVIVN